MEMFVDFPGGARTDAHFGPFTVQTDQPRQYGGNSSAPAPFELFLASLATCAGYFVLEFCNRRKIATEGLRLTQRVERDSATHMLSRIILDIQLPPGFPPKYIPAAIKAAETCTVKRHLKNPPAFEVRAFEAQEG